MTAGTESRLMAAGDALDREGQKGMTEEAQS